MTKSRYLFLGCLAVLIASLPLATQANAKESRDEANTRCMAAARKLAPGGTEDVKRATVYKSCMHKAGYRP